ncbi:hypothetical protein IEE94_05345 [Yimella sp. cx-573]|nr:hypothetical protein [Yimella sp. cx-573]
MEHHDSGSVDTQVSRRALAKGAAWAAPVVALGATAPATAASLRIDPGINGWVLNTTTALSGACRWSLRVNSNPSNPGPTPDGAPYGLYLYDVQPNAVISNAKLTYWIIGDQTATWVSNPQHSSCWSAPVQGALQAKADGLQYRPYTFTYTCPILPSAVSPDGRLRLGIFDTTATFTQPAGVCNDVTYWTQRTITVDQDGSGPQPADVLTFERRNGSRGTYSGSLSPRARSAAPAAGSGGGSAAS